MNNIPGWFPKENEDVLLDLIKKYDIKSVIEIGSFVGKSTVFFAEHCESVIAVEPFDATKTCDYLNAEMKKLAENQLQEFQKNTAGFSNITVKKITSEGAAMFTDITADLIFIDGSHEYVDVLKDIKLWLPRANKVICGDDYSAWWPGVRQAVDESLPNANKENRCWFYVKE